MGNTKHQKYIDFLAGVAVNQPAVGKSQMAAMLVQANNVPVAMGANQTKTHPLQAKFCKNEHAIFLHAEIAAIAKALKTIDTKQLSKCTLYVTRVLSDGKLSLAKPCGGCSAAIKAFGIKTVVWSTETGYTTSLQEELDETDVVSNSRKTQTNRYKPQSNGPHLSTHRRT